MTQNLKRVLWASTRAYERLTDSQRETLEMICHKMGRIIAGNPHEQDHWVDIAGYATLVAQRLSPRETSSSKNAEG